MSDEFKYIPAPPEHRTYKVGESVVYGNHDEAVVLSVSDDKRIYELALTNHKKKSWEKEFTVVKIEQTVDWTRLLPITSKKVDDVKQFSDDNYRPIQYQQNDLRSLLSRVYREWGLDFNPSYQRGSVWDMDDKIALLDSVFAQRDIGKFVFNDRAYNPDIEMCEIIDGKQRLSCLREFFEDRFKYNGLYYSELHWRDKITFRNHNVSIAVLNEASEVELFDTFIAVNTTGKAQNIDHLEYVKVLRDNINKDS